MVGHVTYMGPTYGNGGLPQRTQPSRARHAFCAAVLLFCTSGINPILSDYLYSL
jgi:hypothetical protein